MRNYALITTAVSALLIGFTLMTVPSDVRAQDALADTLPSPASASAKPASTTPSSSTGLPTSSTDTTTTMTPSSTSTTTTTTTTPSSPSSSIIVPVTSSGTAITGGANPANPNGGLTGTPLMPSAVQDAMTRLQKVDQINLDDMIRAQDAINRLDLLLEIEKRQTELKKVRDERNKPAASAAAAAGLLGSAIPASALNLPKGPSAPAFDASSSQSSSSSFTPRPTPPVKKPESESGPSQKYAIKRISGTDGRYFAVINTDDNSSQTVNTGDKLPDGSIVKSISLTSVSLIKDKKSKNLTIPSDSYIVRESNSSIQ